MANKAAVLNVCRNNAQVYNRDASNCVGKAETHTHTLAINSTPSMVPYNREEAPNSQLLPEEQSLDPKDTQKRSGDRKKGILL